MTYKGYWSANTLNGFINTGSNNLDLQYPDDLIENGESFRICVTGQVESCADGYNSEAKKPERATVNLYGNFPAPAPQQQQQQDDQQSQSQSQSSTNNNNVYNCPPGC